MSLWFAAKHHRLSQPSWPGWLALPAGGHGGTSVYVAPGEGGANGRHSGAQRPARGAARRGPLLIWFPVSLSVCPLTFFPSVSLPGSTTLSLTCSLSSCCMYVFSNYLFGVCVCGGVLRRCWLGWYLLGFEPFPCTWVLLRLDFEGGPSALVGVLLHEPGPTLQQPLWSNLQCYLSPPGASGPVFVANITPRWFLAGWGVFGI